MPAISALLFVAVLWTAVAMSGDWLRQQSDRAEVNHLLSRIEAVIEAAYIYRGDTHRWPVNSTELCSVMPNATVCRGFFDAVNVASPMSMVIDATDTLQLSIRAISNRDLAQRLSRSLGKQATLTPDPTVNPNASEYVVRFDIALPSRLSLLEETLLTDGSNAMHKPLFFATTASPGDSCQLQALAVDVNGDLLHCANGIWTL